MVLKVWGTVRRRMIVYALKLHNIIRLRRAINDFDWDDLLFSSQDVSFVYSLFIRSIWQLINHCIPAKTVKISPRNSSYITPIIKAIVMYTLFVYLATFPYCITVKTSVTSP